MTRIVSHILSDCSVKGRDRPLSQSAPSLQKQIPLSRAGAVEYALAIKVFDALVLHPLFCLLTNTPFLL
jgi:hypothetical protein